MHGAANRRRTEANGRIGLCAVTIEKGISYFDKLTAAIPRGRPIDRPTGVTRVVILKNAIRYFYHASMTIDRTAGRIWAVPW